MHDCPTCGGGPGNVYGCLCHRGKPAQLTDGAEVWVSGKVSYPGSRMTDILIHGQRVQVPNAALHVQTPATIVDEKWRACVDAFVGEAALREIRKRFEATNG